MIKYIFPIIFVLAACGPAETTPFCECVNASETLNDAQVELMENEEGLSNAKPEDLQKLRDSKLKACKDFATISAQEGVELKKECENN